MIIVTSLKGEYTEALKTAVPLADTRPGLPPRWGQRGSGHPPKFAGGVPARGWWQMLPNLKSMFTACYIFFLNRLWIVSHFIKTVLMIFFKHHWVSYWAILRQLFRWRQIWSFRLQQRPWWWLKHKYSSFEMNSPKPRSGIMEATESEDNKWN